MNKNEIFELIEEEMTAASMLDHSTINCSLEAVAFCCDE